jgi:2-hydroxychromene-2-carboxylate isomerase
MPRREPPAHEFDCKVLKRAATAAQRLRAAASYGWRLCLAVYGSDAWPLDGALCIKVAIDLGIAARGFAALFDDCKTGRTLTDTAREAYRRGASGVPTFLVGGSLPWGNDRLVLLRRHLTKFAAHG